MDSCHARTRARPAHGLTRQVDEDRCKIFSFTPPPPSLRSLLLAPLSARSIEQSRAEDDSIPLARCRPWSRSSGSHTNVQRARFSCSHSAFRFFPSLSLDLFVPLPQVHIQRHVYSFYLFPLSGLSGVSCCVLTATSRSNVSASFTGAARFRFCFVSASSSRESE